MKIIPSNYKFDITTQEGKKELAVALSKEIQAYTPVINRIGGGVYIREAYFPKGTLIVGATHTDSHLNMLISGSINVVAEDQILNLVAPHFFTSSPSSKVGFCLTDVVWQNIYAYKADKYENILDDLVKFDMVDFTYREKDVEQDQEDYQLFLTQIDHSEESVSRMVKNTTDRTPLPDGSYLFEAHPSKIHGKGLFATCNISSGFVIGPMRINNKRTVLGYNINHSKIPNCNATIDLLGNMYLVASKDIYGQYGNILGNELTVDYRQVLLTNISRSC